MYLKDTASLLWLWLGPPPVSMFSPVAGEGGKSELSELREEERERERESCVPCRIFLMGLRPINFKMVCL